MFYKRFINLTDVDLKKRRVVVVLEGLPEVQEDVIYLVKRGWMPYTEVISFDFKKENQIDVLNQVLRLGRQTIVILFYEDGDLDVLFRLLTLSSARILAVNVPFEFDKVRRERIEGRWKEGLVVDCKHVSSEDYLDWIKMRFLRENILGGSKEELSWLKHIQFHQTFLLFRLMRSLRGVKLPVAVKFLQRYLFPSEEEYAELILRRGFNIMQKVDLWSLDVDGLLWILFSKLERLILYKLYMVDEISLVVGPDFKDWREYLSKISVQELMNRLYLVLKYLMYPGRYKILLLWKEW